MRKRETYNTQIVGACWFTVVATKEINSETMQYVASVEVNVFAENETHAMRKVRPEFKDWHLRVS